MNSTNVKYTIGYTVIHVFFWASFVNLLGYVSMYLLSFDISNSAIGIVLGIAGITAAIFQPMVAVYADKPKSPSVKKLVLITVAVSLAIAVLLLIVHGKSSLASAVLFCISIALLQFMIPFVNYLGTETINQGISLNWGVARGMGSLSFAVASYVMGYVVAREGTVSVPIAIIFGLAAFFVAVLVFPFQKQQEHNAKEETHTTSASSPIAFIKKYPKFSILLIGLTCTYISHICLNSFLFQIVASKGGGSPEMGKIMAFCAIVELPALFGFSFLLKKAGSDTWLRVCAVFMALKTIGTLLVQSVGLLFMVQIFQMFGWGLIAIAPVYYVNKVIRQEDAIKGQAYIAMTYTLGSVLGSFAGGILLDLGGVFMLLIFASIVSVIGMVFVFIFTERLNQKRQTGQES